jgi:signal transduction histidine kinase/DNA-binding response OmpR family regulator
MEAGPLHILIAEDEPAHAAAIRRAFEAAGADVEVRVVDTLRDLRGSMAERPPDIALVDLNLGDGPALGILTQPPEAGPCPILLMTSYGTEQVAVRAIKAGALDYVVKSPEAFMALPRTVERAMREWNLLQERKRAGQAERQHAEQIRLLYEASQRLNRTLDLDEIYRTVHEFLSATVPCDELIISVFDPTSQLLHCSAAWRHGLRQDASALPSMPLEAGDRDGEGIAIRTGRPLLIRDRLPGPATADSGRNVAGRSEGLDDTPAEAGAAGTAMVVPLVVDAKVTGVIHVLSYRPHAYSESQLELLEALALHIASAHQNAILFKRVQEEFAERKQAEEALRQAQKMESLGILAGGVAHDFNNLLVAILGQTSLALMRLAPESPARISVEKAVAAAERAAGLTGQLLAYTGRGQLQVRPMRLNALVEENLGLLAVAIPKHVRLRTELADGLPLIQADPVQLQQVLMNLIINAAEAIGDRPGLVTVGTGICNLTPADRHFWLYTGRPLSAGCYVTLRVQDDGSGMGPEMLPRVFDPFFTTKFTGRGLGLAVVLGIVKGHQGGLHVESAPGAGTTFHLVFPAFGPEDSAACPAAGASPAPVVRRSLAKGLVIDDEEPVREAVSDILESSGLEVLAAPDGAAGIALYRERASNIALVLLDLSMPGLGGRGDFSPVARVQPAGPYRAVFGLRRERGSGPVRGPGVDRLRPQALYRRDPDRRHPAPPGRRESVERSRLPGCRELASRRCAPAIHRAARKCRGCP